MRLLIATCLLLAGCSHTPAPVVPPAVVRPPAHPAPKPPSPHPAPLPTARPEMPDDHTPDHVCTDLAQRRAEDAATLGDDTAKQDAVRKSIYAQCIGGQAAP